MIKICDRFVNYKKIGVVEMCCNANKDSAQLTVGQTQKN